jgi:hypothetical protein
MLGSSTGVKTKLNRNEKLDRRLLTQENQKMNEVIWIGSRSGVNLKSMLCNLKIKGECQVSSDEWVEVEKKDMKKKNHRRYPLRSAPCALLSCRCAAAEESSAVRVSIELRSSQ